VLEPKRWPQKGATPSQRYLHNEVPDPDGSEIIVGARARRCLKKGRLALTPASSSDIRGV